MAKIIENWWEKKKKKYDKIKKLKIEIRGALQFSKNISQASSEATKIKKIIILNTLLN